MSKIVKEYARHVVLYVSNPIVRNSREIQTKLDEITTKPEGLVDDTGDLIPADSPVIMFMDRDDNDLITDELLSKFVRSGLKPNFLMSLLGYLLLFDLTDYINSPGLTSVAVDRFEKRNDDWVAIFKLVGDESTDFDDAIFQLRTQISDGWGENGSDEQTFLLDNLLEGGFFPRIYQNADDAFRVIAAYEETPPDIRDLMYNDIMVKSLRESLTYLPNRIDIRLAFDLY